MSCGCGDNTPFGGNDAYNNYCNTDTPYPIASAESVPSLIANLTQALYGQITKDVYQGKVVWNIPCDPNNTAYIAGLPREPGEGLMCYFIRYFNTVYPGGILGIPYGGTGADNAEDAVANLGAVPTTRSIITGLSSGLAGGGNLTADRSLSIANTTVTPGTYGSQKKIPVIHVNARGQLTEVTEADAEGFAQVDSEVITASAQQTVFTLTTITYAPGTDNLAVYRNGLRLLVGLDYVETNSTTVTLTRGVAAGNQLLFESGRIIGQDVSSVAVASERITASAQQTVFTLSSISYVPGNNSLAVYSNGLKLSLGLDYVETNSNTVTLTAGADAGDQLTFEAGHLITQPAPVAVASQLITATAGQTVFSLTSVTYAPGTLSLSVYRNGLKLVSGTDYTETNSNTVTLTSAAALGDQFVFEAGKMLTNALAGTSVGFLQAGTGAITRNMQDKARESVSVKDFGAVGNGTNDDTAAIQSAIDSLPSAGGALYFPTGTYLVSSQITVNKPGVYFGDGWATNIKTSNATANTFLVTGAEQVHVQQMRFTSSVTKAGGWYVDVAASASRFRISDFAMDGAIGGVRTLATATATIERGQILNCVASTGIPIRIDAGYDVTVRDIISDQAAQTFAGIYITNAGDITLEDLQLIRCGQALYVKVDSGKTVASLWANNCFFDNSTRSAYLQASGGAIVRSLFDQCWFSSSANEGLRLESSGGGYIEGTDVNVSHFFLNASYGVHIVDSGVTNTRIHDCAIAQNTLSGVYVAANVNEFSIQDCRIGDTHGLSGNGYGIYVAGGTSNFYQILNNNLTGNVTADLVNLATGSLSFVNGNLGPQTGQWINYTPTITTGSGTISTLGTVGGKYIQTGKQISITLSIPISVNGTGAVDVKASLPPGMTANSDFVLTGRENSITGLQLQAVILATSGTISITKYDNTYPGGNGYRLIVTGIIGIQ